MRFILDFHRLVRIDLADTIAWHERREPGLGWRLDAEARDTFRRLADDALIYSVRFDDVRRVNLRTFRYGVFYFIHREVVVVLGVLHGARDTEAELQQRRRTYG